jgi:Ras GTPase-activating protein 1
MGSYLVRESDRKPGSYVLSYLGRTGINHFRITAVCGDYYIGKVFKLYIRCEL